MQATNSNRRGSYGEMNAMGVMMDDDDDDDGMLDYDYDVEKDFGEVTKTVKKIFASVQTNASAIRGSGRRVPLKRRTKRVNLAHGRLIKPPSTGGGIISQDLLHGSALLKRLMYKIVSCHHHHQSEVSKTRSKSLYRCTV